MGLGGWVGHDRPARDRHHRRPLPLFVSLRTSELAGWAWTSRTSAARQLQQLRETGVIATGRRDLTVLDTEALRRRVARLGGDPVVSWLLRRIG